jgi:hypothetical protein
MFNLGILNSATISMVADHENVNKIIGISDFGKQKTQTPSVKKSSRSIFASAAPNALEEGLSNA